MQAAAQDVHIRLLGGFSFKIAETDIADFLSPSDLRLLAFLSFKHEEKVGRERIVEIFWPNNVPARALHALNSSLWRIRRAIRAQGFKASNYIETSGNTVAVSRIRSVDVAETDLLSVECQSVPFQVADQTLLDRVRTLLRLNAGELLPDIYDDWTHVPREAARNRLTSLREYLVLSHLHRNELREAIIVANDLVASDPLHEIAHQWLIRCYLKIGDRARAISQFRKCESALQNELGVKPLPETTEILGSVPSHELAQRSVRKTDASFQIAIDKLDAARETILLLKSELH